MRHAIFDSIPRGLKRCVEPERGLLTNRYFWLASGACAALWLALATAFIA